MAALGSIPPLLESALSAAVGSYGMGRISKLARWVGIIGGVGGAAWAMRERFISLAIPREPEPPTFRSPQTTPEPHASGSDDLTAIAGIGPVFSDRLAAHSINSWRSLANRSAAEIAEITGASESRAAGWIAEAAHRVDGSQTNS